MGKHRPLPSPPSPRGPVLPPPAGLLAPSPAPGQPRRAGPVAGAGHRRVGLSARPLIYLPTPLRHLFLYCSQHKISGCSTALSFRDCKVHEFAEFMIRQRIVLVHHSWAQGPERNAAASRCFLLPSRPLLRSGDGQPAPPPLVCDPCDSAVPPRSDTAGSTSPWGGGGRKEAGGRWSPHPAPSTGDWVMAPTLIQGLISL